MLFQLASINEFNAEEEKARSFYERLAKEYPDAVSGKKAAGVLRAARHGRQAARPVRHRRGPARRSTFEEYRGQDPARRLLDDASADPVRKRPARAGEGLPGVQAQGVRGRRREPRRSRRRALEAFLQETPLPWPQIHEPGRDGQPPRRRVRRDLAADDAPRRRRGQGPQPQPPQLPTRPYATSRTSSRPIRRRASPTRRPADRPRGCGAIPDSRRPRPDPGRGLLPPSVVSRTAPAARIARSLRSAIRHPPPQPSPTRGRGPGKPPRVKGAFRSPPALWGRAGVGGR